MKHLSLDQIRDEYLNFFKNQGHLAEKSFSLIPKDDKSLLLIGAGMAPLKKFFTGELSAPSKRMTTCQKCIRTGDIDNVGKTDRHGTFFEMLGNFSFGDYFKKEAIHWAWTLLTEKFEIEPEKLWITVFKDDDEAFDLWVKEGQDPKRLVRLGKEDNFWELETGPSGPCTEIFYDRGEKYGTLKDFDDGVENERLIEVWNLVFTQFDRKSKDEYEPLSHPNIDTGMGLERMACVMQGVHSIFDIKEIRSIIEEIERLSNKKYKENEKDDISIRIIADHVRSMTFMVSDGIIPSNESRGYVLRKIIRRAIRHGKLLGIDRPFLADLVQKVIDGWSYHYTELAQNRDTIIKIISAEEAKFEETINQGMNILNSYIDELKKEGKTSLSGEKAFILYDTYGFPFDITKEILEENKISVDEEEFNKNMQEQKLRAKENAHVEDSGWNSDLNLDIYDNYKNEFIGYEYNENEDAKVNAIVVNKNLRESIKKGDKAIVILDKTPFYGQSGGQVGDVGTLKNDKVSLRVIDTKKTKTGLVLHEVEVEEGELKIGDKLDAVIDYKLRQDTRKNHTATHLLHKALKMVLGSHVNQAGSLVSPTRLRFDFTHFQAMTADEIKQVENIVNESIFDAIDVETSVVSLDESKKMGATGLFEDKYGDLVRVVQVGDFSVELCGGTHVKNTSEVGLFKIVQETGIAAGVRRIEALTGRNTYKYLNENEDELVKLSDAFKVKKEDLLVKAEQTINELKDREREIKELKNKIQSAELKNLDSEVKNLNGINYIISVIDADNMNELRQAGDKLKDKVKSGIVMVAADIGGKTSFIITLTKDVVSKVVTANILMKNIAPLLDAKGGGRDDMAQAGGGNSDKLKEFEAKAEEKLKEILA
ncbi:alanine--tRNA ligase [Fenollaria sporofastidiosus]|uniref:alanine--tRNA ligase n=1 Tax=Fenollaria sporofastidiosus TaxID=2811778 RepID=UPI001BFFE8DC|nr:alanine--tRNA ligase [Fenollaria sporofastidiosus]